MRFFTYSAVVAFLLACVASLGGCALFQSNPSTHVHYEREGDRVVVDVEKGAFESNNDISVSYPTGKDTPPITVQWKAVNDPSKAIQASAESLGKIADLAGRAIDKAEAIAGVASRPR